MTNWLVTRIAMMLIPSMLLTGCATVRRHPAVFGLITGVAVGTTVALTTRLGHCPGEYKSGDPPCPPPDAQHSRHR